MKFLIKFCGKKALIILFSTSMLSLVLDLLSIALIFPFLKLFISPDIIQANAKMQAVYQFLNPSSTDQFIVLVGAGLIVLYMMKLILKTLLNKINADLNGKMTFRLATDLFQGLLNARYSLFTEESTSEMVGAVNAHTTHSMICLDSWIAIVNEVTFLFVVIGIFILLSPFVTLTLLALFLLIGIALYKGLVKKIDAYGQVHARFNLFVYKFTFAVANSIKDIKIMGLENNFLSKYTKIWREYSRNDSKARTAKGIPRDFAESLVFIGLIAACLYVLVAKKNLVDMIPILGVVAVSAMRILPSFIRIINSYNEYKYYRNSLVIVEQLYAKLIRNRHEVRHVDSAFQHDLTINRLGFHYDDNPVLQSVSLTIKKGSSVAFVGVSGSGKSTFLDVLAGLREAEQGEFSMDGVPFDPFNTDALRKRIGYVPQQVSLIDDTIAFNISFEENYDKNKMDTVLRMARLSPFVEGLPQGVDTVVGESGVRVSGGQKQRIGIARALYHDPEILIFDEATSSLDNITERELMEEINALSGSKTLVIVAHRLTTVERCDTIYLLDQGKIIAQGTHKELLARSAEYQHLYNLQQN